MFLKKIKTVLKTNNSKTIKTVQEICEMNKEKIGITFFKLKNERNKN